MLNCKYLISTYIYVSKGAIIVLKFFGFSMWQNRDSFSSHFLQISKLLWSLQKLKVLNPKLPPPALGAPAMGAPIYVSAGPQQYLLGFCTSFIESANFELQY